MLYRPNLAKPTTRPRRRPLQRAWTGRARLQADASWGFFRRDPPPASFGILAGYREGTAGHG